MHFQGYFVDVLKMLHRCSAKGIRSNYLYITDTTKCTMPHITADDNGAYVKRETQISCIGRPEKMLIQYMWMITSTFITLATQAHIRDRMYQSMT